MEKRSGGLSKSCILIIVVAGVERFAFKGVASNLVSYLTDVAKLSSSSAAKSVNSWSGVTSMLPLVTAVLTDSYSDRYSTIIRSSLLYVVGLMALTSWAVLNTWMPISSLFLPLYLISLGQAGYNPSLQAFGAEQLELEDDSLDRKEEEKINKKSLFFQCWYFGICSGSLLGNSVMSYVQDTFGWGLGFAIPTIAMALSVSCFWCGNRFYVQKQHQNYQRLSKTIAQAIKGIAMKIISKKLHALPSREIDRSDLQLVQIPVSDDCKYTERMDRRFSNVDEQPCVTGVILRLLPVWVTLLMFAVIFQLPITFFTKQGMAMNHKVTHRIIIPPAMLQSALTISIILLMPLYDRIIIPVLRLVTRNDKGISILQRIGIGMIFSLVAMIAAAFVKTQRLKIAITNMQMSILWLLPQYILLGVSDVFTVVGMQEFFYTQVPTSMRTVGIAPYLSVFGFGSFLSALLISFIELVTGACGTNGSWFSDDMSKARLDCYYWFLGLLGTISFISFVCLCRFYKSCSAPTN